MRCLLFSLFILSHLYSNAQLSNDEKQYYTSKIEKYLDKEKALKIFYHVGDSGLFLYASPKGKVIPVELGVSWDKTNTLKANINCYNDDSLLVWLKPPYKPLYPACNKGREVESNLKLSGIKIALDPGHIAGDIKTGILEKKSLRFIHNNKNIEIVEGKLTLHTALILKQLLEEQGAEVMLTREKPNQTAFGITYQEWLQKDFKRSVDSSFSKKEISEKEKMFLLTKASERDIFRSYFNNLDMKERIRKINAFYPDLTIVIHYNVDEKNTDWKKPTDKNFNMMFVGGSFLKNEVEKPIDKLAFLRLLLTDDLEESIKLCESLMNSFTDKLNVPAAAPADADYLTKYCMATDSKGVYNRNLSLTRLAKGIVVYGETLYQDNERECLLLSNDDIEVYGIKTSSRVKQVAEAYYEGIMNYVEKKR